MGKIRRLDSGRPLFFSVLDHDCMLSPGIAGMVLLLSMLRVMYNFLFSHILTFSGRRIYSVHCLKYGLVSCRSLQQPPGTEIEVSTDRDSMT